MQELIKALVKARRGFTSIKKDATNPHFKSKYATLDSVLDAVMPALTDNGLTVLQVIQIRDGVSVLVTYLYHESGDNIESVYALPQNAAPQQFGSALTYARRYALTALLNVAADEDNDAEPAKQAETKQSKPPVQPKKAPPTEPKQQWAALTAHKIWTEYLDYLEKADTTEKLDKLLTWIMSEPRLKSLCSDTGLNDSQISEEIEAQYNKRWAEVDQPAN
jgi:hypothetical protein